MSVFRVGQRVRIATEVQYCEPHLRHLLGAETVITSERETHYGCSGYRTAATDGVPNCCGVPEYYLTPITDPQADAFMERMKKLGREPINSPEKVLA